MRQARPLLLALCISLTPFSIAACAAPTSPEGEVTESELNKTTFTRLDRATADQVAEAFAATFAKQLDECAAVHPDLQTVTRENVAELTELSYNLHYTSLAEAIRTMLADRAETSATLADLRAYARPWALQKIAGYVGADGFVSFDGFSPLMIYDAVAAAEEKVSIDTAEKAAGVDLAQLRAQWSEVTRDSFLDHEFLRPVKVDREPSVAEILRHFDHQRLSMSSWGRDAVDGMANAHEGPKSPTFIPIADALKNAEGIKKRWLFQGYGDGWSRNVLIVQDEKNQLWGFMMGYSE